MFDLLATLMLTLPAAGGAIEAPPAPAPPAHRVPLRVSETPTRRATLAADHLRLVVGERPQVEATGRVRLVADDQVAPVDGDAPPMVVELRIVDGNTEVEIDGEPIPADRIVERDGRIVVLDASGRELPELHGFMTNRFVAAKPPTVMIGLHHAEVDAALAAHLGLAAPATLVTAVLESLPAQEAGLAEHDVIVAIDGTEPADPARLLEVIRAKTAGDEIRLRVVSPGSAPRDVVVGIAAWDGDRLASARVLGHPREQRLEATDVPFGMRFDVPEVGDWFEDPGTRGRVRQLLTIPNLDEVVVDSQHRVFERAPRPTAPAAPTWRGGPPAATRVGPSGLPGDATAERLDRVDARLAELEALLRRLLEEAPEAGGSR